MGIRPPAGRSRSPPELINPRAADSAIRLGFSGDFCRSHEVDSASFAAWNAAVAGRARLKESQMAQSKKMTKSSLVSHLAEENEMSRKQVIAFMDTLVDTAYRQAKNGFTIPGIGKLVLVKRKARMGRNPATGESIKIPAKTVVKFRVAKQAKDAILTK